MPRRRLMLLALVCGIAGPLGDSARTAAQAPAGVDRLRTGMTAGQVRDLLGPPTNISRRVILYRTHEQWHYAKSGLRLSFDHPRGAAALLVRVSARE